MLAVKRTIITGLDYLLHVAVDGTAAAAIMRAACFNSRQQVDETEAGSDEKVLTMRRCAYALPRKGSTARVAEAPPAAWIALSSSGLGPV